MILVLDLSIPFCHLLMAMEPFTKSLCNKSLKSMKLKWNFWIKIQTKVVNHSFISSLLTRGVKFFIVIIFWYLKISSTLLSIAILASKFVQKTSLFWLKFFNWSKSQFCWWKAKPRKYILQESCNANKVLYFSKIKFISHFIRHN